MSFFWNFVKNFWILKNNDIRNQFNRKIHQQNLQDLLYKKIASDLRSKLSILRYVQKFSKKIENCSKKTPSRTVSPALECFNWNSEHIMKSVIKNCPRKMYQIKNWTDGKLLKIQFSIKKISICRKWSGGRRAQTPYYSSSGMMPSCSTSHCKLIFIRIWCFFAILFKISLKNWKKMKFSKKFEMSLFSRSRKLLRRKFHLPYNVSIQILSIPWNPP